MSTNLERIDLQIEVLVLDQAVDSLSEDALEVTLTGPAASVSGHHPRYGCVGSEEGSELGGSLEL